MQRADEWVWQGPEPAPDYAMFPGIIGREIIRHLTGAEWKVLYLLAYRAHWDGRPVASVSLTTLQRQAGISRSTVLQALQGLCARGLIEVVDLRPLGPIRAAVYRVLITEDRRYVARSNGSKIDPSDGSKIDPDRIENRSSRPLVSFSLNRERGERSRARARAGATPSEDPSKFYRGQYAMCPRCGVLHCDCEDR